MERILQFLAAQGSFLYRDCGFRFVDSRFGGSFGDDAWVEMTNGKVGLLVSSERGSLYLDLRSEFDGPKKKWYPLATVRRVITNQSVEPSGLTDDNAAFLRERFKDVESLFGRRAWAASKKRLTAERADK